MNYKQTFWVLIVAVFFIGCAAPSLVIKDPAGREMPDPHYVLEGINYPVRVMFYYTAFGSIEDDDGTNVHQPVYLNMMEFHNIDRTKYDMVMLTIEIHNPYNHKYKLLEQVQYGQMVEDVVVDITSGRVLNASSLEYRQFVYVLPFGEDISFADYLITMVIEDEPILQIGNFRYQISQGEVIKKGKSEK
jgi:hypothetical protein